MASLSPFNAAFSGIQAAQAGILVSSQNVSGSAVDGFSRRRSELVVSEFASSSHDLAGTGFAVDGFARDYAGMIEAQRTDEKAIYARGQRLVDGTATLDTLLMDPATSLGTAFDSFFSALGAMARDPESPSLRAELGGAMSQLNDRVRAMAAAGSDLRTAAQKDLEASIAAANQLAGQLAKVNASITLAKTDAGAFPSADLLDARDRIVGELKAKVGGQSVALADGSVSFYLAGQPLVEHELSSVLRMDGTTAVLELPSGVGKLVQPLTREAVSGGSAGADLTLLEQFVPEFESGLDTLVGDLASKVNALIPVAIGGARTDLITFTGGIPKAANLQVDVSETALRQIDGPAATQMEHLRGDFVLGWEGVTASVGKSILSWRNERDASEVLSRKLDAQREDLVGINLDEEAANMMRYQQLYSAASKVLETGSRLFDELISVMR